MQQTPPEPAAPTGAPPRPRRRPLIIAVTHQKGGSGKTTTVCNLATVLARYTAPERVAVVDLDAQASASHHLRPPPGREATRETGTYEVLTGHAGAPLHRLLRPTAADGVLLLPAGERLDLAEIDPALRDLSHRQFIDAVTADIGDVACVLLDCAPGFGVLSTLAMMAADVVLIPTPPVSFAESALTNTIRHVKRLRADGGSRIGLLLTMIRDDVPQHRAVEARLRDRWQDQVFATAIPFDPAAEDAVAAHAPVVVSAPDSAMAGAYVAAAEELYEALAAALDVARTAARQAGPSAPAPDAAPSPPAGPLQAPEPEPPSTPAAAAGLAATADRATSRVLAMTDIAPEPPDTREPPRRDHAPRPPRHSKAAADPALPAAPNAEAATTPDRDSGDRAPAPADAGDAGDAGDARDDPQAVSATWMGQSEDDAATAGAAGRGRVRPGTIVLATIAVVLGLALATMVAVAPEDLLLPPS